MSISESRRSLKNTNQLKCFLKGLLVIVLLILVVFGVSNRDVLKNLICDTHPDVVIKEKNPHKCDRCLEKYSLMDDIVGNNVCLNQGTSDPISPHTLFIIMTSQERQQYRQALRQTWLQITRFNKDPNYRHVFIMGMKNTTIAEDSPVRFENYMHRDILIGNFSDNASNQTLKMLHAMTWADMSCNGASYLLITSDQVLFNHSQYMKYFTLYDMDRAVAGRCMYGRKVETFPVTPTLNVSKNDIGRSYYPDFCLENGMIVGRHALMVIAQEIKDTPYFFIPSIYMGFILEKLKIKAINLEGYYEFRSSYDPCTAQSSAAVIEVSDGDNVTDIWTKNCSVSRTKFSPVDQYSQVPSKKKIKATTHRMKYMPTQHPVIKSKSIHDNVRSKKLSHNMHLPKTVRPTVVKMKPVGVKNGPAMKIPRKSSIKTVKTEYPGPRSPTAKLPQRPPAERSKDELKTRYVGHELKGRITSVFRAPTVSAPERHMAKATGRQPGVRVGNTKSNNEYAKLGHGNKVRRQKGEIHPRLKPLLFGKQTKRPKRTPWPWEKAKQEM